ncbi:MAG: esterase [Candidatus Woesearchaeota archaeon]|nr:MAG: esterase [Candidatus Woesearchaeota archaeon]
MKVGLVLSGGGARGFAQIGVLKVLNKNKIPINKIAGCSIGALIGACYAYDQNPERIEELLLKIKSKKDVYDYSFSIKGLIKGEKLQQYIEEYFEKGKETKFDDLKIPLSINATDIVKGEEVIFDDGLLIPKIMASLSYPGFFTIRKIDNKLCIDGGVTNPLPLDHLKDMDYLIIIDVSEEQIDITEDSNFKDIILQSAFIMQKKLVEKNLKECNKKYTIIKPDTTKIPVLSFKNSPKLIVIGEKEAKKQIEKIKKDIGSY